MALHDKLQITGGGEWTELAGRMEVRTVRMQMLDARVPCGCRKAPSYLMIFLQYVVHLSYVFAGDGFDYKAAVVGGQEAVAEATLRVAVERRAPRQRVLSRRRHNLSQQDKNTGLANVFFWFLSCSLSIS